MKNVVLYRGQPDASWHLDTTLERYSQQTWTMHSYSNMTLGCAPAIESYTDTDWNLPSRSELDKQFAKPQSIFLHRVPLYRYWIYLRHHGFPSPLLDWTHSPYIAAYFALAEKPEAESAAVFAFIEMPEGGKGTWEGIPQITVLGPNVRTHRRHFLQQCDYTVCTKLVENKHDRSFINHETVFGKGITGQDILIKITIPRSERRAALLHLREMNITEFSLFQTQEALMKALALERIEGLR